MNRNSKRIALIGIATLATCIVAGCGTRCGDLPPFERLEMTLTPETVSTGEQVTVVASFDRNVFDNVGFYVDSIAAYVLDATGVELVGQFHDSAFRRDMGEPPFVSGVILTGEVLDDRTFQMTLEFPAGTEPATLPVEVRADSPLGECSTGILGEATLSVTDGS